MIDLLMKLDKFLVETLVALREDIEDIKSDCGAGEDCEFPTCGCADPLRNTINTVRRWGGEL